MGITIKDVALRAGVSMSTVSRVLNNICPVDSEKRLRVERAVEELGYTCLLYTSPSPRDS